jgi:hypothetical protein
MQVAPAQALSVTARQDSSYGRQGAIQAAFSKTFPDDCDYVPHEAAQVTMTDLSCQGDVNDQVFHDSAGEHASPGIVINELCHGENH